MVFFRLVSPLPMISTLKPKVPANYEKCPNCRFNNIAGVAICKHIKKPSLEADDTSRIVSYSSHCSCFTTCSSIIWFCASSLAPSKDRMTSMSGGWYFCVRIMEDDLLCVYLESEYPEREGGGREFHACVRRCHLAVIRWLFGKAINVVYYNGLLCTKGHSHENLCGVSFRPRPPESNDLAVKCSHSDARSDDIIAFTPGLAAQS